MRAMYDSVTVGEIPHNATAVLGYNDGEFNTAKELDREFPHADKVILSALGILTPGCNGIDCEPGDVPPTDFEAILKDIRTLLDRGVWRPVVYASQSNMGAIVRYLTAHGIKRARFRVLSAHYGLGVHICSPQTCRLPDGQPCDFTADGTQITDHALSRNLDESILHDDFFPHHLPKRNRKPVKKVAAAGLGGAITTGILAAIHAAGLHLTPAEVGFITTAGSFLSGYAKSA